MAAQGQCLCGAVRLSAKTVNAQVGACHCTTCRQWGGGPLLATDCGTEVTVEGQENLSVFNSSDWAERGFCKHCGTHLFYRLKEQQQYFVPVGLFTDSESFVLDHQVFIDEKPEFYCFANETHNMTGAELFAQFAAETEKTTSP
ncbi:MAG: GFA family protein [Thermosynechococcaceae cyanobacterium]